MTHLNSKSSLSLPPGDKGLPFIGETVSFFFDPDFTKKKLKKYGNIFRTNIFGNDTVTMIGAEANQFLFRNENKYVVSTWPKSTRILLGKLSLAVKDGTFHTSRRTLLFQAFKPRALDSYIPKMTEITQKYKNKWLQTKEFAWYPELRDYTFDVACSLLISTENASQTKLATYFETWCKGLFSLPINLPWTSFGKALKCRQKMLQEIEKIIIKRQQEPSHQNDALGILLEAKDEEGNSLTLEELKDQILLLLFAGHETLTSAMSSFVLLMAQHPDILDKVRKEQEKLNNTDSLTPEKIKEMTYLEQVLKEVLRLIPPVGGGFRKVIKEFEFEGYRIPKNWTVQYQIAQTHQQNDTFPNYQIFDPERFSPENMANKQKSFGYVPFGGGLRECLGKEFAGLEMKIFASILVLNCHWELLPDQNLEMITIPSPRPRDGLKVKIF
ncbi:cytochrome P450 [Crocosphaera sp. Alani8]|uniref:cytochrome P450 n=1 Tax=Crocosphaera sp. Alani8 TaxID=3038952 RepID=UPI00313CAF25